MKIIYATNGDEIKVSDCDFLFLCGYNWSRNKTRGYYCCNNREIWNSQQIHGKRVHWFISQLMNLKIPKGYTIDHIDRDKSNNQRENLRIASAKLQAYNKNEYTSNKSGYSGVHFSEKDKKWVAQLGLKGTRKHLGYFNTKEEASKAYQKAKETRNRKEIEKCKQKLVPLKNM